MEGAVYCIPYTVYCILYIVHCIYCISYTVYTVYRTLYTLYRILYTVYCIPYTVYCILYTINCILYTVYCTLCTVYNLVCSHLRIRSNPKHHTNMRYTRHSFLLTSFLLVLFSSSYLSFPLYPSAFLCSFVTSHLSSLPRH